jgi:uncharacterized protein YdhG (YjbR/CyaY superfamily)
LRSIQDELAGRGLAFADEGPSPEVDAYIATFDAPVRERLAEMRSVIRARIPKAKERMAYGIPTYSYGENVVHFAGFKSHIGFFPTPSGITALRMNCGSSPFPRRCPIPAGERVAESAHRKDRRFQDAESVGREVTVWTQTGKRR